MKCLVTNRSSILVVDKESQECDISEDETVERPYRPQGGDGVGRCVRHGTSAGPAGDGSADADT